MASGFDFQIEENAGPWRSLVRTLENLQSGDAYVKAGVIGEAAGKKEHEGGPLTNGELATIHEFGTQTIPARPFILGTFSMNRGKYLELLRKVVRAVYLGKASVLNGLKLIGEQMASDMRNRMVDGSGIPPPLAASTIAAKIRKGVWNAKGRAGGRAPRPLVDSGRLRNSISYAVVVPGQSTDEK